MGQCEIFMYVALGFGTAALIALLLARLLWSVAVGVGRRRVLRTAPPPAVAELQSERNRLQAEYAMLARKVEVREDECRLQVAEQMAEVSRSRNRIERLSAEIDRRDAVLSERESEIARLTSTIGGLEAELNVHTGLEPQPGDAGMSLSRQLAERDQRIERLRAEVDRLGRARSEAVTRERTVQERLKGRIEDLSALSRQIEEQRRELLARQSQSLALRQTMSDNPIGVDPAAEAAPAESEAPPQEQIEVVERQASELQGELDRLDGIWAAKLADVASAVASEPIVQPPAEIYEPAAIVPQDQPVAAEAADAEEEKKSKSGLANVISLAQRIRALQRSGS
jgi:DNA repair exonuclease SbcCD ATPase subunit